MKGKENIKYYYFGKRIIKYNIIIIIKASFATMFVSHYHYDPQINKLLGIFVVEVD